MMVWVRGWVPHNPVTFIVLAGIGGLSSRFVPLACFVARRTISNLFRAKPPPPRMLVDATMPVLTKLLSEATDKALLADLCWSME